MCIFINLAGLKILIQSSQVDTCCFVCQRQGQEKKCLFRPSIFLITFYGLEFLITFAPSVPYTRHRYLQDDRSCRISVGTCGDPESFCQRGSNSDVFVDVFFDEGRKDPDTTINWPSSACQRNAVIWRFAGGPTMA